MHYIAARPPPKQWITLSKPMLYTLCIHRQRHATRYMVISDHDEYFTIMANASSRAAPLPLGAFLDAVWPPDTAATSWHDIL